MKQKTMVRMLSLIMAVLMVMGVMAGVMTTASAAAPKKSISVYTARQPDLTFYDLEGGKIGTFSHSASSDLIGFNSTRVIYKNEEGQQIETNYGRVDVTLHLADGTGKYSELTETRRNSYYLRYNMGSSTGEAFANRITCSKGKDDAINLDIELPNVVFRDDNEMKMNLIYQYSYKGKGSKKQEAKTYIRTKTLNLNFTFGKAKLDLTVTKPTVKPPVVDQNGNITTPPSSQGGNEGQGYPPKDESKPEQKPSVGFGTEENLPPSDDKPGQGTPPPNQDGGTEDNKNPIPQAQFETPYLLLKEYSTGGASQIAAGTTFPLSFTCVNTSQQVDLENIILKITPGEGMQIVDSTNVFYIPIINKSSEYQKSLNISVLPNAQVGAHTVDVNFSYEYLLNGSRQRGDMTQQISVSTVQPDRFSADPLPAMLETIVGEEIYLTGKYVNKSRGELYNLSATLEGEFAGAGQTNHVGNIAAGASGEVEFSFTPDTPGPLDGQITYSYEDATGNVHTASVPFSTTIGEAPVMDDMMSGGIMPDLPMEEEPPMEEPDFLDIRSWKMWAVIGGGAVVILGIVLTVRKRKKAAAEFEDDDENI